MSIYQKAKKSNKNVSPSYFTFNPFSKQRRNNVLFSFTFPTWKAVFASAGGGGTVVLAKMKWERDATTSQVENVRLFHSGQKPGVLYIQDSIRNNESPRSITLQMEHSYANSPEVYKCKGVRKGQYDFKYHNTMLKVDRGPLDYVFNQPGKVSVVSKPIVTSSLSEISKPLSNSKSPGNTFASISTTPSEKNELVEIVMEQKKPIKLNTRQLSVGVQPDFYSAQLEPLPFQGSIASFLLIGALSTGVFAFGLALINRVFSGTWVTTPKLDELQILALYDKKKLTFIRAVVLLKKHHNYSYIEGRGFLLQKIEYEDVETLNAIYRDIPSEIVESLPYVFYSEAQLKEKKD